jgi:hypothetical protein
MMQRCSGSSHGSSRFGEPARRRTRVAKNTVFMNATKASAIKLPVIYLPD